MIAIWDNRLCTGDAVIDAEHRLVLKLMNEVEVALSVRAPDEVIGAALDSIQRAVRRHFDRDGARIGSHEAFLVRLEGLRRSLNEPDLHGERRRILMDLAGRWIEHMSRRAVAQTLSFDHAASFNVRFAGGGISVSAGAP